MIQLEWEWFVRILCFTLCHRFPPKISNISLQNKSKVLLKNQLINKATKKSPKITTIRILHFSPSQKIHPQIVNILFIINLQKNFEFYMTNFIQFIGDCNYKFNLKKLWIESNIHNSKLLFLYQVQKTSLLDLFYNASLQFSKFEEDYQVAYLFCFLVVCM